MKSLVQKFTARNSVPLETAELYESSMTFTSLVSVPVIRSGMQLQAT